MQVINEGRTPRNASNTHNTPQGAHGPSVLPDVTDNTSTTTVERTKNRLQHAVGLAFNFVILIDTNISLSNIKFGCVLMYARKKLYFFGVTKQN